jgi:Protein of Unknown function (DUF2784)
MKWRVLADLVVAVHAAYVGFVVLGLAAIVAGYVVRWRWVRNGYFRLAHLAAILFVCAEALGGWVCPLTTLENVMRQRARETAYAGDFIGYWLDWLIFYNAPAWVFTTLYTAFGALVVAMLWLVPPRFGGERRGKAVRPR